MKIKGNPLRNGVILVAIMGLLVAGCGSSGPGAKGGVVKIGILTDLTGELGAFGKPWVQGFQLAADEINRTGGLPGGAKIQTIVVDAKTDPAAAVQAATRLIDVNNVSAIVGPTSGEMIALVPLAHRAQVPIVSNAAGDIALNKLGGSYIYRTVPSDNSDGLAAAKFITDRGATKAVVVYENQASTASIGTTFSQSFQAKGGQVTKVAINPGQTSYQAQVGQALSARPSWIFCACGQQSGAVFYKQAYAAGYRGKWLVSADLVVPAEIKAIGQSIVQGAYGEEASPDNSLPAYQRFATAYRAKYHAAPGFFASNAYDAMMLVALAMVKADSTSATAINGAIRAVAGPPGTTVTTYAAGVRALKAGKEINYNGASGSVDFDASGTVAGSYAIFQVKGSTWKQVQFYPTSAFTSGAP